MFSNMISKRKEAKELMDETKTKMESIFINAEAENGMIKVVMNANKKIKDIYIDKNLMTFSEKGKLEKSLASILNKAMENADKIFDEEIKGISKGYFPTFPFLF